MSLEEKIEALTQAVVGLTAAIAVNNNVPAGTQTPPSVDVAVKDEAPAKPAAKGKAKDVKKEPEPQQEPEDDVQAKAPTYDDVLADFMKLYQADKEVNGESAPVTLGVLNELGIKGKNGGPPKIAYLEEDRYAEGLAAIRKALAMFEPKAQSKDVSFV